MSTNTKESIAGTIEGLEHLANSGIQSVYIDMAITGMRRLLASLEAEPVPEWTNEQCIEFLSIAFRHAKIKGDLELDDIRLGVKMVNGSRASMLQGTENAESLCTIRPAPALDSLPKNAESRTGINQGNSEPVTSAYKLPEGWVAVPVEPTSEMYDAGDRQLATKQVWDAMVAAAPNQEVK